MARFITTMIAAQRVIGDSKVTVIGAMIIAPFMKSVVATTAALMNVYSTLMYQVLKKETSIRVPSPGKLFTSSGQ